MQMVEERRRARQRKKTKVEDGRRGENGAKLGGKEKIKRIY